MKEKWLIREKKEEFQNLAKDLKEDNLILRLLANRNISNPNEASLFLYGKLSDMYNPFLMEGMKEGVEIIKNAIKDNKRIIIYGDYDCDGVCSTTILYKALKKLGANFSYHIPNRESEGYGMNKERIKILKDEGAEILLTCDNGISAFDEIDYAKELGLTVIVTDHHDIPLVEKNNEKIKVIPNADVVINPKREDCNYPFKELCGAGVAYKFVVALYNYFDIEEKEAYEFLEYASIATVCDVVSLLDENRIILKEGLKIINNTKNLGLKELIKIKKLEGKEITEGHFGFVLGPCINATGRLEIADYSVKLLIAENKDEAKELAEKLNDLNEKRQELTIESVERVDELVKKEVSLGRKVILVYDNTIHESIAGIVAGRIRERYNLPTIVMTKGSKMPKGSGRSIEGYNMFEELSECKELMDKFGGHPMAAGLSCLEENIPRLREKLNKNCKLTDDDIIPKILIDAAIPLENLNFEIIETLNKMKPFGKSNSTPVIAVKNVLVKRVNFLGKEGKFLKFNMQLSNGKTINGINFNKYDYFKELFEEKYGEEAFTKLLFEGYTNFRMDIIYYPEINEFNGNKNIQVSIKNFRL